MYSRAEAQPTPRRNRIFHHEEQSCGSVATPARPWTGEPSYVNVKVNGKSRVVLSGQDFTGRESLCSTPADITLEPGDR